ncbi:MAG: hypothetical protein UX26_C0011G0003 [Parcubacteria group bacterium GW2011_GWC1_45_9]|nr:MAG: hypothetical protein UW85_C0003G0007 [Parcubacteria group bacterium GW2011_GWA1_Parcubacteria_45_10]KKU16948.1 MAG: hypothetical protein UX26_C0011G0003 [Parcubacteria group bacterium GW2011_GWC1_45_9]
MTATGNIVVEQRMSLERYFRLRMEECSFVAELSDKLEEKKLDCWPNLEAQVRYQAQRSWKTAERLVDDLFSESASAEAFMAALMKHVLPAPRK